jgi:hypothetical protein
MSLEKKPIREESSHGSGAPTRLGHDEKEISLERGPVRGDQERPIDVDPQTGTEGTKSFLRYDERRW